MSNQAAVKKHRDAMRAAGFRPVQIWVPDTKNPKFVEEYRRQCAIIAANPDPDDDLWDKLAEEAFEE